MFCINKRAEQLKGRNIRKLQEWRVTETLESQIYDYELWTSDLLINGKVVPSSVAMSVALKLRSPNWGPWLVFGLLDCKKLS